MPDHPLARRVDLLEEKVDQLMRLPDRIDALEISVRAEIRQVDSSLHADMVRIEAALRQDMAKLETSLRQEIRSGDEETRRFMRVLHEDLVSRIALLGERRPNTH